MSRAALLPTPGDPFLFTYWYDLYRERWAAEIDHLYVCVNNAYPQYLKDYIRQLVADDPKVVLTVIDWQIEHGAALEVLLRQVEEDYVMLVEDDGFIFQSGWVNRYFSQIESGEYDLLGSRRGSCSDWLIQQANGRWGLDSMGEGDTGPNFWPNYLFTKTKYLRATDLQFGAKAWVAGEVVWPFNLSAPSELASDTFVWASMQLREMGLTIGYIPQYHGSPADLEHAQRGYNLFDGLCYWTHVGSLSSGLEGFLSDKPLPYYGNTEGEKMELERRVSFWQLFSEHFKETLISDQMVEFKVKYDGWIARVISHYGLSPKAIETRKTLYRGLMNWI